LSYCQDPTQLPVTLTDGGALGPSMLAQPATANTTTSPAKNRVRITLLLRFERLSPGRTTRTNVIEQSRRGATTSRDKTVATSAGDLPSVKAFVLQFSRETAPDLKPFIGRLEHLATGRRIRFHTMDELLAAVARLL
jgi:hypothetical protein